MFPQLKLVTYYNSVAQENFLNLQNIKYEIKIFYCASESSETEIPITDSNLKIKLYGDSAVYKEEDGKRYLYTVGVGSLSIVYQYPYGDVVIENTSAFRVYVPGYYPRLKMTYWWWKDGSTCLQQLKYLDNANQKYELRIELVFSEDESVIIPLNDTSLHIEIFDRNIFYQEESGKRFIYPVQKGTCIIGAYYTYAGQIISLKEEVLVYETFFKNHFAIHGFSAYDYSIYHSNPQFKIVFDTLLEFIDILYAYYEDIDTVNNPAEIKNKFLTIIGASLGFEKKSLYNDTKWEFAYSKLYRELLSNLIDLIGLRGTKTAYELFFGALGYDIDLLEYWFDQEGNLIEINYEDFENSTFYAYTESGIPLEDFQTAHVDPRKDVKADNPYNYCNKSPYIRVIMTLKSGLYHPGNESMATERILIRQYLEWLRPNHLKYLQEIYRINVTQVGELVGEHLINLLDGTDYFKALILKTVLGDYIHYLDNSQTPLTEIDYPLMPWPTYIKNNWVYPVGLSSNLEFHYAGPWHSGLNGYHAIGLSGKTSSSPTGLAASTTYYFDITIDGLSIEHLSITTGLTSPTYGQLVTLLNSIMTKAFFSIVSGDLRCTSYSVGIVSSILLENGSTTPTLFSALLGSTIMAENVSGTELLFGMRGYQGIGITIASPTTNTGLSNGHTYYFKITPNNSTPHEYAITTPGTGTVTYDVLINLINNVVAGTLFYLVPSGTAYNMVCRSNIFGIKSMIRLDHGTTGDDLFSNLSSFVDFAEPVDGQNNDSLYGDNRGICIEHLKKLSDNNLIVGENIEIYDSIETPLPYDSQYEYDEENNASVGIKYDKGIILNEKNLEMISTITFKQLYSGYVQTHTKEETLIYLASFFNTTVEQCRIISTLI